METSAPIYLDNAATTPVAPEVIEAIAHSQRQDFGNPSSAHSFGRGPHKALDDAREFLRGTLGAAEVVFTSGGSEADFLGIVGSAAARPPGRVLMAATDHPAILECANWLGRLRHHVTVLPVGPHGDLGPEALFDALGADVRTVALLHGHNELGTLCDLPELVSLIRRVAPEAHIHVDLVQSYGKIPFELDDADVDSVAVSAHKLHGPRGVGLLALSSKARIAPVMKAGGQEAGLRGGTENVAGAVGLMVAAELALSHQAANAAHLLECGRIVEEALRERFPGLHRLGHPERHLPHIWSLRIPGVVGQTLMERCDQRGVAFSIGSACHGGQDARENAVLKAIGIDKAGAREVIRVSFGRQNTLDEVQRAAAILAEEAAALAAVAPAPRGRGVRRP